MVSLVDLVPKSGTVATVAGELTVHGLGMRQVAELLMAYPPLRNLITEGAPAVDLDTLCLAAPEAVASIICTAARQPDGVDALANGGLPIDDLVACLVAIRDLTLGAEPGPFVERLKRLRVLPNGGGGQLGAAPAMSAPRPSKNLSTSDIPAAK